MLSLGDRPTDTSWQVPIVRTVAVKGGGADDVVDAIERHGEWLSLTGELARRRTRRAANEVSAIALTTLRQRIGELRGGAVLERLAKRVAAGELDSYTAAEDLVTGVSG